MAANNVNLFQIWKVYQRRAESIAHYFDMKLVYYHYSWEENSRLLKAASYILKSLRTLADLIRYRPKIIFIQLPPTPALYVVALYSLLTRTQYIADCHNGMILRWWLQWPFTKTLLRKASAVIVHNNDIRDFAAQYGIQAIVLRDPLPQSGNITNTGVTERFGLERGKYIIAPWNLQADEPIAEFIAAVRMLPDITFVMTWFFEKLPVSLKANLPANLVFTGYLEIDEFNDLFTGAGGAISLTTQQGIQPSAAAEAIAFSVPIILSDTETARLLYRDVPVFVRNESQSIADGVSELFRDQALCKNRVEEYKGILNSELESEVRLLAAQIKLTNGLQQS